MNINVTKLLPPKKKDAIKKGQLIEIIFYFVQIQSRFYL